MKIDDMIMISVDDHVVEPPDVFEGRLAAKYSDRAPHIVRKADGDTMIDVTLTAGFAVSAATILLAAPLAAVVVIAGVMTKVKVEVVRVENDD